MNIYRRKLLVMGNGGSVVPPPSTGDTGTSYTVKVRLTEGIGHGIVKITSQTGMPYVQSTGSTYSESTLQAGINIVLVADPDEGYRVKEMINDNTGMEIPWIYGK